MTLTLRDAIAADQTVFDISGADTLAEGSIKALGDEYIVIRTVRPATLQYGESANQRVSVDRGALGTVKVAHAAAVELAAVSLGGGAGIAATDEQVVFMDGTDAVGSPDLTWHPGIGNGTLGLVSGENGTATITGLGLGVQMSLVAADGDADHVGGELTLQSGGSAGFNGGQINIVAGGDSGGGDGGSIVISSGVSGDGASGDIDIKAGGSGVGATGGDVHIQGGVGQTGSGGDVLIAGGTNVSGGTHGSVELYGGGSSQLEVRADGVFIVGGLINFDSLPTADPAVAGQLWVDSSGFLKVSAG